MNRKILFALAILTVMCAGACSPPQAPTPVPNIYVNNNAENNSGGSSTGGSGSANCPAPSRVDVITRDGSTSISIAGTPVPLDATPKPPASDECNQGRQVAWTVAGPCRLTGNVSSYDPFVIGISTGTCSITANVAGAGGVLSLPVVP